MGKSLRKFSQDVVALGFLGGGLFVALSLLSYDPLDPSLNSIGRGLAAKNLCGVVGSFTADLLYQLFGFTAWCLPAVLLLASGIVFRGSNPRIEKNQIAAGLGFIISTAALLSIYLGDKRVFSTQILPGGAIGFGVTYALILVINKVGAQIFLWLTAILSVAYLFEVSVTATLGLLVSSLRNLLQRFWLLAAQSVGSGERRQASQTTQPLPNKDSKNEIRLEVGENSVRQFEMFDNEAESKGLTPTQPTIKPHSTKKQKLNISPPARVEKWEMPNLDLLEDSPAAKGKVSRSEIERKASLLTEKLKMFNIEGEIVNAKPGPLVTMFEFRPNADVKISEISNLEDDLSLALASDSVRVMGQIPGTNVVGIETANSERETVFYKDLVVQDRFWSEAIPLPIALGKQANGEPKIENLRSMPHLLIAGTTGSGKSVFVRSIIAGLLLRHSPKTLRLVLVDPKMVDLADFASVPHLALPHITEPRKATQALRWMVREMDKRYRSLSKFGVAKIEAFNERVANLTKAEIEEHEKANATTEGSALRQGETYYYTQIPYIVVVIDELADLMAVDKQNIEGPIQRLTQKARACGIHLILATQSPRKDVVTGLIKTNIPGRVALKVASKVDSRIILDDSGAERLLPNGDMLFLAPGVAKPSRHHGPYLSEKEIQNLVKFWSAQALPEFDPSAIEMLEGESGTEVGADVDFSEEGDEMYQTILRWAIEKRYVSASLIQRQFRLGYPRAARIIETFEKEGIVGPANGSKPRQVLVSLEK
ncbi:MAG: DNA translocase FtsK 4TM domain-containing protein [Bdellovibrionaceae bacterium]|nr:DNA translocase FtsK 4TM domain-containing protein [Pseudobdellovibrionaceae bacterium]